jgi:hypothetical protein
MAQTAPQELRPLVAEPQQQPAGELPPGSPEAQRQSQGAVARGWMQPAPPLSLEDGPPLARRAVSLQWPGAAAEARSQSGAPAAAAA